MTTMGTKTARLTGIGTIVTTIMITVIMVEMMKVTAMMARTERMTMMTKEIKLVLLTPQVYHKSHRYETRQSSTLAICPIPWPTARMASALDNKSVPYSHREGYTWRNTTANELMARWQGLPYVKKPNGQIIITGVS
jgi:hypothetical protein